jgi:hypothetical protein
MNRRDLLKCAAVVPAGLLATQATDVGAAEAKADETAMKLRPHHLLDIVNSIGHGEKFSPHPYGHALHLVAKAVLADVDRKVQFVVGADDICKPCKHLKADGLCDDVAATRTGTMPKQEYNDQLDRRLLKVLDFREGAVMTVREYLKIVGGKLPGLEKVCSHPKEDQRQRLKGLVDGLQRLGIREQGSKSP